MIPTSVLLAALVFVGLVLPVRDVIIDHLADRAFHKKMLAAEDRIIENIENGKYDDDVAQLTIDIDYEIIAARM